MFKNNRVRLVKSAPLAFGIHIAKRTRSEAIVSLMRKLRPLDCGKELIRVGGQRDGGYLIPYDLEGIEYCFSPGVDTICDFETHLANLGIKSFLADYSVDGPSIARTEFTFDKRFLGSFDRGHFMTLAFWKDKYLKDYTNDLLLQMDIEGYEYEVILNAPIPLLNQFRIMVIEFHYLDRLFDPFVFSLFSSSFEKLLQHFHVAHIHPNNCRSSVKSGAVIIPEVLEFTFINKRRVRSTRPRYDFPHKLDVDNRPENPLPLPKCWYSSD
jgi:hypothetical protein